MLKIFILFFVCISQIVVAQKCSYIFDDKNVFQNVQCSNLGSLIDVADEIQSNWTSVKVVNRASHPQFSNNAVNVPHLNVIQSLDLSHIGSLTLSDAGFRDFDSLKKLDIAQTGLTGLKSSWFTKKTIEELNVSENFIKALKKEETKFFSRLRIFNASFNEIKTVEANTFLESKKVEVISLSHNQIVNALFENLPSLTHLYMKGNSIVTVFAVSYHKLPRLETLNLAENQITGVVDRSFSTLENLKYLNLSNNKLPHIGPWMFAGASKIKLEELDFSFNLITMIYPICLHELNVLTFLDLSDNKIVEIFDKNFMKSTTLQVLKLGRNRISKIAPKSFEKMLALKSLDISNNKLETFTPEMFNGNSFAGNKLRKLNLSFNLLTTLKENLFSLLLSLTHLDLSSNKFGTLPADLLKLNVNLEKLVLSNNQIQSFPSSFFDSLTALQELSVDGNRISFLPSMMGSKRLMRLTISNNPWQCNCLRETIFWAKNNRIQLDDAAFNPPFPSCVVIPETTCIKDAAQITRFQLFDKYQDGVAAAQMQFGRKRADL